MIIKLSLLFPALSRQREERKEKKELAYTHKQWVTIDRIVIIALFLAAIILPIVFS